MTKAIVLAGGKGTRLRPYTSVLPKPLMPIGDRPILEVVLRQLEHYGIRDITLAVGYLAELLMAYCGDGSRFGVTLDYSREETPLGTAGPISLVAGLNESFVVMNGDVLTTLDFEEMGRQHDDSGAMVTVAVHQRDVPIDLGVVEFDESSHLTRYIEKPVYQFWVSMGIYFFRPEVTTFLRPGEHLDLPDLVRALQAAGETVRCYRHDGYWLDIGRTDDYESAIAAFTEREAEFLPGLGGG